MHARHDRAVGGELLKSYSVTGAYWAAWAQRFPRESSAADEALMRMVGTGELRPRVSRVLPWQEYATALAAIRARTVHGREVLAVHRSMLEGREPPSTPAESVQQ